MAKLPIPPSVHNHAHKIKAAQHPAYIRKTMPRSDKGVKRGPLTSAQKAQRAAMRSITLHTKNEINALGPLTPADIAAIAASLKKPHCTLCTERCPGGSCSGHTFSMAPHTCGHPSPEQFGSDECILLCHARRPCRQTPVQNHANQMKAWNDANHAEAQTLAALAT